MIAPPTYKYVVMTPLQTGGIKSIYAEKTNKYDEKSAFHVASGDNIGIIINHENTQLQKELKDSSIQLECYCVMKNNKTLVSYAEKRSFKFWFDESTSSSNYLTSAYGFYNDLVDKKDLPRDYVGFVRKTLKLLQLIKYHGIIGLKLDFIPTSDIDPSTLSLNANSEGLTNDTVLNDKQIKQLLQQYLEEAYPSNLTIDDLKRLSQISDSTIIQRMLEELEKEGLIQSMSVEGKKGSGLSFIRKIQLKNHRVCELGAEQNDKALHNEKPTIGIITNLLVEKIAVDSMISNKTTYTRYKIDGESHVYTIGYIGKHKVISTKLPTVGRELNARISSGNITTRLLGTFQSLSHIILVGVAGGVQHMHDFKKHSRLGDILVSCPSHLTFSDPLLMDNNEIDESSRSATDLANPLYIICDRVKEVQDEHKSSVDVCKNFAYETYGSRETELIDSAKAVVKKFLENPTECSWSEFLTENINSFDKETSEFNFNKPPPECDRINYRNMLIAQPKIPDEFKHLYKSNENVPLVRFGCFGAGRPVIDNENLRNDFANEFRLLAFDAEFDQVIQSIMGNGVHSYLFIRGISDYVEGRQNQEWQPYSALSAASFMKSLLMELEPVKP